MTIHSHSVHLKRSDFLNHYLPELKHMTFQFHMFLDGQISRKNIINVCDVAAEMCDDLIQNDSDGEVAQDAGLDHTPEKSY